MIDASGISLLCIPRGKVHPTSGFLKPERCQTNERYYPPNSAPKSIELAPNKCKYNHRHCCALSLQKQRPHFLREGKEASAFGGYCALDPERVFPILAVFKLFSQLVEKEVYGRRLR